MSTITAQILIGKAHPNHGGILSHYSTLNFSENSRPAWIVKHKNKNIVWVPTVETTLEDGILLIALNFLENMELNNMAKCFFSPDTIKESSHICQLKHKKTTERIDTLYNKISMEHLNKLHTKCQQISWGSLKIIINLFQQSHLLTQLQSIQKYSMDIEVCTPIYSHLYSNRSRSSLVTGITPEKMLHTHEVKYSVFEKLPEEITQKLEIIETKRKSIMNEVSWYEFASKTISLLEEKARQYDNELEALMSACGYAPKHKNTHKFLKHQKQWTNLSRNIPKAYLNALDISIEDIKQTLALDQQLYQKALTEINLDYCQLGDQIGHFHGIISETDAINVLKIYARKRTEDCKIYFKHLKTIIIKADASVSIISYRPEIIITKTQIAFTTNPVLEQICCII